MNSKKILSAILAGACTLSMTSIAAFAADETITAAGEKKYDVEAGYTAPVIDVTLPTELKAVINPYQIAIEVETGVNTGTDGIASPEYKIVNNDSTFGIKVGAKLSAKGTGITVAATPDKIPTKLDSEKTAFAFLNTTVTGDGTTGTYANAAYDADDAAQLAFTEDIPDRATILMQLGVTAGTDNIGYFKIQGQVTDPEIVEKKYATTDKLALSVIFDINPYNPGVGGVTPPAGGFTADVAAANISLASPATLGALVANNTYAVTYDGNVGGNVTPAFTGYTITNATCATAGCTVRASDARFSCAADGTYDIVIELENDADSTDTPTITFRVTATDC